MPASPSIVVSDWYGELDDGTPYFGIDRAQYVDMSDPTQPNILGEALAPAARVNDVRVVGSVIYAVSVDYGTSFTVGSAAA